MSSFEKKHHAENSSEETGGHVFVKKHLENSEVPKHNDEKKIPKEVEKKKRRIFSRKFRNGQTEERLSEEEIVENLNAIYQNRDGSLPDMKNFQRSRRVRLVQTFFSLILFGLFCISIAFGIMYYLNLQKQGSEDFVVTISSPETVQIGSDITFRIRYRNPQDSPISQASMSVRYPEGFVFENSSVPPTNDEKTEWKLGVLGSNAEGFIDITGKVYGSLHDKESLRVFFNYLPANFSSEFQKVATQTIGFESSPIQLVIKSPAQIAFGSPLPIEINIGKLDGVVFDSLMLRLNPNQEFMKKGSEPVSDALSDLTWTLDPKNSTTTIKIQGVFLSSDALNSTTTPLVFDVLGFSSPQKTGKPLILAHQEFLPNLYHTALETKLAVNGSMNETTVIPGQNLNASIVVKNTGEAPLKNIEVTANFDAPSIGKQSILDWKAIQDNNNGVLTAKSLNDTRRQGILTWTGKQIPDLKNLAPGKEVHIDVFLPVKKNQEDADKYTSWNIVVGTDAKYEIEKEKKTVTSNVVNLFINSDLTIEVRNEISGEGNSLNTVTWLLGNTYHPLKNIEAFAEVFGDTKFDESKLIVPAGKAAFESDKKIIRWTIPDMPVGVDVNALQFGLISNKQNLSQTQLTSKVTVHAIDTVTNKEIIIAGDEILMNVPIGEEKQ
jgi:hypothetical protein